MAGDCALQLCSLLARSCKVYRAEAGASPLVSSECRVHVRVSLVTTAPAVCVVRCIEARGGCIGRAEGAPFGLTLGMPAGRRSQELAQRPTHKTMPSTQKNAASRATRAA